MERRRVEVDAGELMLVAYTTNDKWNAGESKLVVLANEWNADKKLIARDSSRAYSPESSCVAIPFCCFAALELAA